MLYYDDLFFNSNDFCNSKKVEQNRVQILVPESWLIPKHSIYYTIER